MSPERFAPLPPGDAAELLRVLTAHDEGRALSLAFVPDEARAAALAACAFVAEAASLPARVSDPTIGMIRVQWWREALEEAVGDGTVRAHPLAQAVRRTLEPGLADALQGVLDAMPPFLEGGGGAPADLLSPTDGAMGRLVAGLVSPDAEATPAGDASVTAALARLSVAPPAPARSPQIETPRQRAARMMARDPVDVLDRLALLRRDWPRRAADGVVLGALPVALAGTQARGRVPGPVRARLSMMRMVARGRP